MFEHHKQPLIPREEFVRRLVSYAAFALLLVAISWLIGILGYRIFEGMSWMDSTLNAAMILGGMGPVNQLQTNAGKLFASFYALFSGIVFLVSVGVLLAPIIHRLMHQFHLQSDNKDKINYLNFMRQRAMRVFTILGMLVPLALFFSITVSSVSWLGYDFISEHVSVLGSNASPVRGFANFFGFGLFGIIMMGVAWAVSEQLKKNYYAANATRLFLGSGLLISLLAFFPTDRGYANVTDSSKLHSLIVMIVFAMLPLSIVWHALAFRSDQRWGQLWVIISFILGLGSLLTGIIIKIFPRFYFNGTIERLGVGAILLWVFLVSSNCFFLEKLNGTRELAKKN